MINFTQAFDSAWERMHVILFRPFDFGKWCAVGLSAFLAGFLQGGNGFNFNFNGNPLKSTSDNASSVGRFSLPQLHSDFHNLIVGLQMGIIVLIVLIFIVFIFAIILVVYWLGARGQFLFLDNIVRNRGAITWPWRYYSRQANSLFFFYLLVTLISLLLLLPIFVTGIVLAIPLFQHHRWPEGGEIGGFIVLGLAYLAVALVISVALFIFREFGIPIMFRQGLLVRPAFMATLQLIGRHPGSIAVFVLLRIAIFIGVAVLSTILCCVTCCVGITPVCGNRHPFAGAGLCALLHPRLPGAIRAGVQCLDRGCAARGPGMIPPFNPPPPLG